MVPQHTARFLGFVVDAQAQAFRIPEDKVQAFTAQLERQPMVTGREAAQLAGKIISMAPVIGMAPIHSQIVARALVGIAAPGRML